MRTGNVVGGDRKLLVHSSQDRFSPGKTFECDRWCSAGLPAATVRGFLTCLAVVLALCAGAGADTQRRLPPRSCPPFYLKDEGGRVISPVWSPDEPAPYSPRETCGTCHPYQRIVRGYHFQMGAEVMTDDYGEDTGRPWDLSNGWFGKWDHLYYRQLARKDLPDPPLYDLTPSEQLLRCGRCHPGRGVGRTRSGRQAILW